MSSLDYEPEPFEVGCQGARHRIRWCRNGLVLDHHPDPDAEAVLTALGGDQPPCLAIADLWADAVTDGGFVAEWSTCERPEHDRPARITTALNRLRLEGVQDLLNELAPRRAARMGLFLATFSPAFQNRAAVQVAQGVLARPRPAEHELAPFLARAVRVRSRSAFVRSLTRWREYARPAALVRFHCRVLADPMASPTVLGQLDGSGSWCELSVGLAWLVDVWGRSLDVVDGHLVVACSAGTAFAVDWVKDGSSRRKPILRAAQVNPQQPAGKRLRWGR